MSNVAAGSVTINIPNYPSSNRTPGVFFGVDNSGANTATPLLKTVIIGQITSTATATPNVPFFPSNQVQVNAACGGAGSMLALMYATYCGDDSFGSITLLPVQDNAAGVASISTITITGTPTQNGTLAFYIAGQPVPVAVTVADTPTVMAANLAAAMLLVPTLPATGVAAAGVVTVTARHKGLAAGDVDLRLNYRGSIGGENTPLGVTVAFANPTPGTTEPVLTTAISNISDAAYRFIITPYATAAPVASIISLLSDATGSWSPLNNYGGGAFSAYKATFAALATFGATNNNQHLTIFGLYDTPTPVYLCAASFGAVCAASLRIDPALPLTSIVAQGVLAPPVQSRFIRTQRNTLLYDGIATTKSNPANQVIVERAVTTYNLNLAGAPDNSYLQTEILFTLQAVIDLWKSAFSSKYARVKLVDNGTTIVPGSNTVNPFSIQSEVIAQYQVAANLGLVQDVPTFAKNVNVQKASPYQVNVYAPIQLADQLFVIAVDLAFTQ